MPQTQQQDFDTLTAGVNEDWIARLCEVSVKTVRRWRAGSSPPSAVMKLIDLCLNGVIPEDFHPDWNGWQLCRDGQLVPRSWGEGVRPADIVQWWYQRSAPTALAAMQQRFEEVSRERDFYRRQCLLEARMGMALLRIMG